MSLPTVSIPLTIPHVPQLILVDSLISHRFDSVVYVVVESEKMEECCIDRFIEG